MIVITDKLEVDVLTTKGCDLTGDRTRDLAHRRPRTNQLEIQVCINESNRREPDKPIRSRSHQAREKSKSESLLLIAADWLRGWRECHEPITERSDAKLKY